MASSNVKSGAQRGQESSAPRQGKSAQAPGRNARLPRAAKKPAQVHEAKFEGFPKDFLAFFRELSRHNDREWFAANKARYLASVQQPMLAFIAAMDIPLGRIADCFVADARPSGGSMFRIYRDTRFAHDKTPYKEHASCQFRHVAGKDAHAPGFYVHIEPKEIFFGGGIWRPPAPVLQQIREAIVADPERWKEVTRSPSFRRRFRTLEGESLKRPPKGFPADHPLVDDLKRTSYFAVQTATSQAIASPKFVTEVVRSFQALAPFMEFLTDALSLPFHLDA